MASKWDSGIPKRIQELAVPKGKDSSKCEICGKKATVKCEACRVTHYCSQEHKQVDAISFHKQVCDKLYHIRREQPLPHSEADRLAAKEDLTKRKEEVLRLAKSSTRKWLLEGKPINAYPSAMIAFNIASDLYPSDGDKIIYPACLASEMFLNMGDIEAAKQYMVHASYIAQKHDMLPGLTIAQLNRLIGLVSMILQRWVKANKAFAEYVYAIAIEYNVKDIRMGVPYGLLGLSLLKCDNYNGAMASFHRMADKWLTHLLSQYEQKTLRVATFAQTEADGIVQELEFQYLEAKIVMKWIYEVVRGLGMDAKTDLINFKVLCFQAMCHMRESNRAEAVVYKQEALATAMRTKQDRAVPEKMVSLLGSVLGEDYLKKWEKKHNRPRTIATKYLEMIKAIEDGT